MCNSESKSSAKSTAYIAWLIVSLFYAYQYVLRVMPSVMATDIVQKFQIDSTMFGQFAGIYYLGYSLMHIPVGIMLDSIGPKKIMPICIF